ncbi:MAG: ABC transporter substrate-binding protein, partial [Bradyrhizobium sp.]
PWSNVLLATAKPVLDSGALLISSNAGPSELAGRQCHPNFFAVGFQNDTPHEAMGKYAAEKGFKRIYLLAPNYPAGKDALAGFKRFYKEPLAGEIYTPLNQLDYAADLAQLRAAKPDAVYFFYAGGMGANFLKQYRQADLPKDIPLLGPIFSLDNIIVTATGDAALGARASTFWSEVVDNPANKRFVTDFKAAYGRPPTSYAATSYDTAMLIKSAVQKLGKGVSDRKTLREELLKANFESVRGPFRFNTNQFPVQDFFVADLVKDANGRVMVGPGTRVMEKHVDAYASLCKLITN